MDATQEVPRGPVIATYIVKITVRGPSKEDADLAARARASMTPDDAGFFTPPKEDTPTNEAIEEGVSLGLMRYLPDGATATVTSERSDR